MHHCWRNLLALKQYRRSTYLHGGVLLSMLWIKDVDSKCRLSDRGEMIGLTTHLRYRLRLLNKLICMLVRALDLLFKTVRLHVFSIQKSCEADLSLDLSF